MATRLNIKSDFEFDFLITRRNATTREKEAATGLAGVTGRFSLSKNGLAIGSCTVALSEAGSLGRYTGILDTATMVTDLTAYLGQTIYAIASKSGDLDGEYQEYVVADSRKMET